MNDPIANALNTKSLMIDHDSNEEIKDDNQFIKMEENELDSLESDFEFARKTIRDAISAGTNALKSLGAVAMQSQSARTFEVYTNLTKTLSDMSKDLMSTHKIKRDADPKIETSAKTVNNNLFVGSTQDLQRFLRDIDIDDAEDKKD